MVSVFPNIDDKNNVDMTTARQYSTYNPFNQIQQEYVSSIDTIKKVELAEVKDPMNRSLEQDFVKSVDNFIKVKLDAAHLSNSMINPSEPLNIPQLQEYCQNNNMFNMAYPNITPQKSVRKPAESIFVNDMFVGDSAGPMMNVLDMSSNYRSLAQKNPCGNRSQNMPVNQNINRNGGCVNSSFSNRVNQEQFRSGSNVVAMMADNGKVYHFDNGNRAGAPLCASPNNFNQHDDMPWTPQNAPVLTTMTKEQYVNNLQAQQRADCQNRQARERAMFDTRMNLQASAPLNNPNNPVWLNPNNPDHNKPAWKPLDSKYLN